MSPSTIHLAPNTRGIDGLAASMAFGAAGESFYWSMGNSAEQSSFMLSAGNMDRLVAKLSKMRGAALKLGQMLSFQGS